jgi:hypothetical protein
MEFEKNELLFRRDSPTTIGASTDQSMPYGSDAYEKHGLIGSPKKKSQRRDENLYEVEQSSLSSIYNNNAPESISLNSSNIQFSPSRVQFQLPSISSPAPPHNMTQVLAAIGEQAKAIASLQQAIANFDSDRRSSSPSSFTKWGELKQSLESKSSCAEVDELRSIVKGLESKLAEVQVIIPLSF